MISQHNVLSWATFFPLLGLGLIVFLAAVRALAGLFKAALDQASRVIAMVTSGGSMVCALLAWHWYDPAAAGFLVGGHATGVQLVQHFTWIKAFNVEYLVGVDGLSISMVLLSGLISFVATIASMPWWGTAKYTAMAGMSGLSVLVLASVVAVLYSACYGFTVEKIAYKPLRKAPRLSPLISAIGMSIFLQNYVLLAQTSDFLPFPSLLPDLDFLKPYIPFIGPTELIIVLVTAVIMVLLTLLIKFTKMGKAMRATAQDRDMAMLVGVNVNRVISSTFIIGSALAAIGGVLIASHIGRINFYIGFIAGIKAFAAAVLGGIGSIPGAVLGALILGWTESFATGYISSDYEDVFAFALLVLILIFRPAGLLGRSSIQKV